MILLLLLLLLLLPLRTLRPVLHGSAFELVMVR